RIPGISYFELVTKADKAAIVLYALGLFWAYGRYGLPVGLVLPHRFNNIQFSFGAIETSRPELIRYTYQLDGYDRQWSRPSRFTTANYGNLPEGRYTFRVRAFNPDGSPRKEAQYTFVVRPPFYRTWWAYLLTICTVLMGGYRIVNHWLRKLDRKNKELEELVSERTAEIEQLVANQENIISERTGQLMRAHVTLLNMVKHCAHNVREPLTRILGAIIAKDLFTEAEFNNEVIPELERAANQLDASLIELIKIANQGLKDNGDTGEQPE
ncbi:MAG: hypothetical protein EBZ77_11095, partial [Chitinophagia bacterium]|nr:hypothetical protein [Chitinophagia bacterium]